MSYGTIVLEYGFVFHCSVLKKKPCIIKYIMKCSYSMIICITFLHNMIYDNESNNNIMSIIYNYHIIKVVLYK